MIDPSVGGAEIRSISVYIGSIQSEGNIRTRSTRSELSLRQCSPNTACISLAVSVACRESRFRLSIGTADGNGINCVLNTYILDLDQSRLVESNQQNA